MPYYSSLNWHSSDCIMTSQKQVQIPATMNVFLLTRPNENRAEGDEEKHRIEEYES